MKKLRIKNMEEKPDATTIIKRCIQTVDGIEDVHINLGSGEITYSPGTCTDENLIREALALEGIIVEDIKN